MPLDKIDVQGARRWIVTEGETGRTLARCGRFGLCLLVLVGDLSPAGLVRLLRGAASVTVGGAAHRPPELTIYRTGKG